MVLGALGLVVTVAAGNAAPPTLAAHTRRHASDPCRAPELAGLTLKKARVLAAHAGCKIRVVSGAGKVRHATGRIPQLESEQLIARQVPRAGGQSQSISVSLVPLCAQSALPGAPPGEPFVTAGPTELLSGLYLAGGPLAFRPRCLRGVPSPGTITVVDPASGVTVASATVARGRLATIPLAPGSYTIEGQFGNATTNGVPIQTGPQTVTIPAGMTVRQDLGVGVP